MWNRLRGSRKRRVWPFKNFDRIPKDRRGSAIPDFTAVTFSTLNSTSPQKSAAEGPTALWMKEPNLFLLVEKRGTTTQAGHVRFAINTSMHAQNMSTVFGGEASARTCQGQLFHFALGDSRPSTHARHVSISSLYENRKRVSEYQQHTRPLSGELAHPAAFLVPSLGH